MAVTDPGGAQAGSSPARVIDLRDLDPRRRWRAWARRADRISLQGAAANAASALTRPRSGDEPTIVLAQLEELQARRGALRPAATDRA